METIEEKVSRYNQIQQQCKVLLEIKKHRNEALDRETTELMLEIEQTHMLYFDVEDQAFKVEKGVRPRIYLYGSHRG